MEQLVMRWHDDGAEKQMPVLPEGVEWKTFPALPDALQTWLEIVRYMDRDVKPAADKEFYEKVMVAYPHYREDMCNFLTVDGAPAATVTVICDEAAKEGYIHMVSCKPEFRGRGLGHLLNAIAVYTLKKAGMKTAWLTTDDWRIPAIRTYLKAGFAPDLESQPDFKERWHKICAILNG